MNCANHPDRERAAFCQSCGKPLCADCVHNVGTSIYCGPCLTARTAGPTPPSGFPYPGQPQPGPMGYPPPGTTPPGAPNPALAALLGFIPGVGAMYNEQYAKGIVHLMVFAVLVSLASDVNGIFGLFVAGWICYMAVESYHTARARRDGTPLPNPFGLNDLSERLGFGRAWPGTGPHPAEPFVPPVPPADPAATGPAAPPANPSAPYGYTYTPPTSQWAAPPDASAYGMPPIPPVPPVPPVPPYPAPDASYYRRFPAAAIWLIALGVIFLLGNIPFLHILRGRLLAPIFLIGLGVWIFVRRMTDSGQGMENDGTPYYQWRLRYAIHGGIWWVLVGGIWMLDALHVLSWGRSWPLFLIVGGVMMFISRAAFPGYGYPPPPSAPVVPPAPATTTELAAVDTHQHPGSGDQEGR